MAKLIDKIEHNITQVARWFGVIFVILFILFIIFFVIKPMYLNNQDSKENSENLDKSLLLDRDCLTNIGNELCSQKETTLKEVYIDQFGYTGTFNCFNLPKINITSKQLEECSN